MVFHGPIGPRCHPATPPSATPPGTRSTRIGQGAARRLRNEPARPPKNDATATRLVSCGKAALTPEMALRIEKAFGPDMDHLLRMQLAYDVARTRKDSRGIAIKRYVPA